MEQDPEQVESELEAPGPTDSGESLSEKQQPHVDHEMADEYGFTPQQAKAMSMYLQLAIKLKSCRNAPINETGKL